MLRKAVQDRLIFQGLLWIVYAPNYHDACSSALALGGSPGPENLLVCRVMFIAGWSSKDATSRQSLLQLGNACVGDMVAFEVERLQLGQPLDNQQQKTPQPELYLV